MSNFKSPNPPHIVKALKKVKSQYKFLVSKETEKFKRIQSSCAKVILNSTEFNSGSLKVNFIN
jgi:hypothetical protein